MQSCRGESEGTGPGSRGPSTSLAVLGTMDPVAARIICARNEFEALGLPVSGKLSRNEIQRAYVRASTSIREPHSTLTPSTGTLCDGLLAALTRCYKNGEGSNVRQASYMALPGSQPELEAAGAMTARDRLSSARNLLLDPEKRLVHLSDIETGVDLQASWRPPAIDHHSPEDQEARDALTKLVEAEAFAARQKAIRWAETAAATKQAAASARKAEQRDTLRHIRMTMANNDERIDRLELGPSAANEGKLANPLRMQLNRLFDNVTPLPSERSSQCTVPASGLPPLAGFGV